MRMARTNRLRVEALETREVPAGDLAHAFTIAGLPETAVTRVAADATGNQYVTGTFTGTLDLDPRATEVFNVTAKGGTDVFVAKYSATGQLMWAKTLSGMADESAADIAFDGIGNVYVAGTFTGAVDFNPAPSVTANLTASAGGSAFLWKLSTTGNLFHARAVSGTSSASGLAVDPSGRTVVTGKFKGTADFNPSTAVANLTSTNANGSAFVWRLEPTGAYTWASALHTTGSIEAPAPAIDGRGFVHVGGHFTGTADFDPSEAGKAHVAAGTNWTPFVLRLGHLGNYNWAKTARVINGTSGTATAVTGLGVDGAGNVYAAGTFAGNLDFDPGTKTVALVSNGKLADGFAWKLDPAGNFAYAKRFGGANAETVADLTVHPMGTAYIAGTFTGVGNFNPNPNPIFAATLVAGSGETDGYVLKLSPTGALTYTRSIGGGGSTTRITGLWADTAQNMYVTGTLSGVGDFDPATTVSTLDGDDGAGFVAKLFPPPNAPARPQNLPPLNFTAGGPYFLHEGQQLIVHAKASDVDSRVLQYHWDLNGDGKFTDERGADVLLTPARMATLGLGDGTGVPKTIAVRITDGVNLPVEVTASVTVLNLPPTVKLSAPATVVEGTSAQLTVTNIGDPSLADAKAGLRYSWDFNDDGVWDLGDGATYAGSSTAATMNVPASFLTDDGPLAVRVRAFDKDGGKAESTVVIQVANAKPTATLEVVGPTRVGSLILFRFVNLKDVAGDLTGLTFSFDFDNDGVFEESGPNPRATRGYAQAGTFPVRAMITDKDGGSTVYTTNVTVTPF
jgi:hypothetical protein